MQPKEFKFFYSFQNKSALVFFRKSMYLNYGFMTLLSGCYWDSGGKQGKNHAASKSQEKKSKLSLVCAMNCCNLPKFSSSC